MNTPAMIKKFKKTQVLEQPEAEQFDLPPIAHPVPVSQVLPPCECKPRVFTTGEWIAIIVLITGAMATAYMTFATKSDVAMLRETVIEQGVSIRDDLKKARTEYNENEKYKLVVKRNEGTLTSDEAAQLEKLEDRLNHGK